MSKLAGSLTDLFAGYAAFWLGITRPVPPFEVGLNGPDVEIAVAGQKVVGRLSAYALLAHRFWAAVLPPPVVIPSLIREGNEGRDWDQFDEDHGVAALHVAAGCLEQAGERTEAALVHRLLARTDGDWGVPPWTSTDDYLGYHEVPASLVADVAWRSPVVERLAGRRSWNVTFTVKALQTEDDWALVTRTIDAPDGKRDRSAAYADAPYWNDLRLAGSLDVRRAVGLARAAEATALRAAGEDLWLVEQIRSYGEDRARKGIERLIRQRAYAPGDEEAVALRDRARELCARALEITVEEGTGRERFFRANALWGSVGRAREALGDRDGALAAYRTARDIAVASGVPGDWWAGDIERLRRDADPRPPL
ncbi:hypothetical protein JIG36_23610 [Actinoplanes sp. LDG1-06]|uniref:Uncharacterized protein n=1 Tax=Paractinoplanes ovalisporus TaxID=2810368 RepID=A0ABS2AFF6_9ACTN|nr:hypothetical protein [Actinoplanes ovalisporus]MBM2618547.1 hypothetical protein [Actinoplanes ovalisporus]